MTKEHHAEQSQRVVELEVKVKAEPSEPTESSAPQCRLLWVEGRAVLNCESVEDMTLALDALTKGPIRLKVEASEQLPEDQAGTDSDQ